MQEIDNPERWIIVRMINGPRKKIDTSKCETSVLNTISRNEFIYLHNAVNNSWYIETCSYQGDTIHAYEITLDRVVERLASDGFHDLMMTVVPQVVLTETPPHEGVIVARCMECHLRRLHSKAGSEKEKRIMDVLRKSHSRSLSGAEIAELASLKYDSAFRADGKIGFIAPCCKMPWAKGLYRE